MDDELLNFISVLSTRSKNILLYELRINTVNEFVSLSHHKLINTRNCGKKAAAEIQILQLKVVQKNGMMDDATGNSHDSIDYNVFPIIFNMLSVRAKNVLISLETSTLEGFLSLTKDQLLNTRNCGILTASEIIFAQDKLIPEQIVLQYDDNAQRVKKPAYPNYKTAPRFIFQAIQAGITIRSLNTLRIMEVDTLDDFMSLGKKQLLDCKNSGVKTANEIFKLQSCLHRYANELLVSFGEFQIHELLNAPCIKGSVASLTDTPEKWDDFQATRSGDWLYGWLKNLAGSERNADVFMLRMGMRNQKPETLQEIGSRFDLSRERVRQIVRKMKKKANSQSVQYRLLSLFDYMKDILVTSGGVLSLSELVLATFCQGENNHPLRYATKLVEFFTTLTVWESVGLQVKGGVIRHEGSSPIADWLSEVIVEIASVNADVKYGNRRWSVGRKRLLRVLQKKVELQYPAVCISNTLLDFIMSGHEEQLRVHGNRVYSKELWGLRFGSKMELVENVLRGIRKAAHFTDIAKEVRKWQPGYSDRNTHAVLDRSRNALLWDLGTFIHKDYVDLTKVSSLLKNVEEWLFDRLRDDIPFISVYGAFLEFSIRCQVAEITSEYALYSCLRKMSSHGLKYPRMPYIYLRDDFTGEVSASSALENFIRKAGRAVSAKELESFATQKLYLKLVEQFMQQKQNIQHIIRVVNGGYLHLDNYKHNVVAMQGIIEYTHKMLNIMEYCSTDKIYRDKQVVCSEADIDSSEMLYSLLQHYAEDQFTFPGIGGRQISNKQKSDKGHKYSTSSRIVEYVKELRKPCYYSELKKQFVDELGFNERIIYSARNDDNLLDYQPQCLIHKQTLRWNEIKQLELEEEAYQLYHNSHKAGELFGKISRLVYSSNLPDLPHELTWTKTLLTSLLAGGDSFILLGSSSEAYVPLDNNDGIQKLEDIIALILESDDWKGVTNHKKFTDYLVKLKIIKKSLTSDMLSPGKNVIIKGSLIGKKEYL